MGLFLDALQREAEQPLQPHVMMMDIATAIAITGACIATVECEHVWSMPPLRCVKCLRSYVRRFQVVEKERPR